MHLLVIDTETSGLDPACNALIEIGAVLVSPSLEEVGRFQILVQPCPYLQIDPESLCISGLSLAELGTKGVPEVDAIAGLSEFVRYPLEGGPVVLAGWNISFDQAFLMAAFRRVQIQWPFGHRSLDIQSVWAYANDWDFGGLTKASQKLFGGGPPHRAMPDALLTLEVLKRCSRVRR